MQASFQSLPSQLKAHPAQDSFHRTHPQPPVSLQKEAMGTPPSRVAEQASSISSQNEVETAGPTLWIFITRRLQPFITKLV